MSVFNVSFANKKTQSSGQDYGILVDQLDILESTLAADGKLSPGDYTLLTQKAQQLYGHPGLSPAQRSNIEVKIASYKSSGSKSGLKDAQDITQLNNEVKDDQRKASIMAGNNPAVFLKSQAAIQNARVRQLADAVNSLDASGQDSSAHMNEYNDALSSYQDTLKALDYVEKHVVGSAPTSDYAAYITTNSDGEIVGVNVAREGSITGGKYYETNGLYGGLKIYGLMNHKENGKNVFLLGNQKYSGTDVMVPGPDGTMKNNVLVNESMQKGKPGIFTTAVAGYTDMNPQDVKTQSTIRSGGYAEGSNGFIYQKGSDGKYTKYVNATPDNLNISSNQIIKLPTSMERSIIPQVATTTDMAHIQPTLPVPATLTPSTSAPVAPTSTAPMSRLSAGSPPPQPTSRSPQSSQGLAQRVMGGAKSFLAGLFGGGQ